MDPSTSRTTDENKGTIESDVGKYNLFQVSKTRVVGMPVKEDLPENSEELCKQRVPTNTVFPFLIETQTRDDARETFEQELVHNKEAVVLPKEIKSGGGNGWFANLSIPLQIIRKGYLDHPFYGPIDVGYNNRYRDPYTNKVEVFSNTRNGAKKEFSDHELNIEDIRPLEPKTFNTKVQYIQEQYANFYTLSKTERASQSNSKRKEELLDTVRRNGVFCLFSEKDEDLINAYNEVVIIDREKEIFRWDVLLRSWKIGDVYTSKGYDEENNLRDLDWQCWNFNFPSLTGSKILDYNIELRKKNWFDNDNVPISSIDLANAIGEIRRIEYENTKVGGIYCGYIYIRLANKDNDGSSTTVRSTRVLKILFKNIFDDDYNFDEMEYISYVDYDYRFFKDNADPATTLHYAVKERLLCFYLKDYETKAPIREANINKLVAPTLALTTAVAGDDVDAIKTAKTNLQAILNDGDIIKSIWVHNTITSASAAITAADARIVALGGTV